GKTGFLVADETEMAAAVARLPRIAGAACRTWVAAHCDIGVVTTAYERAYRGTVVGATRLVAMHG
ncbi:MAG: glycosyltransferase family 4 protein, partial [Gaiellaceae bacterium]